MGVASPPSRASHLSVALQLRHFGTLDFRASAARKLLQFLENVLSLAPYGYSKEKCIPLSALFF